MNTSGTGSSRRRFLGTAVACGAGVSLTDFSFLRGLPRVTAQEAKVSPRQIHQDSGVEPMVRLLEETPQDQLLELVADRIRRGTSYREVLAALLLSGVRNVQPHPSVGFKFHAVLVVNSAHLASMAAPDSDRWLPIFWALDYYKAKQLEEERTSGWKMPPLDEGAVPPAHKARAAFVEAMDSWDAEAADLAVAGLVRSAGANELFELFCRYGARDYRSIGHKAIFVANSWRTLQCIGWHHAEPVLRSLTAALLNHGDEPNPAKSDLSPDRPWRRNLEEQAKIRPDWLAGESDPEATQELVSTLRGDSSEAATQLAVELLNRGVGPQAIWDALFLNAGELLMRQPGIIGLHAVTTTNALHYGYQASGDAATRRLMLLQNCAFLPMFRASALDRGKLREKSIDELRAARDDSTEATVDAILSEVSRSRDRAATDVVRFLHQGGDAYQMMDAARRLVFTKGNDAHDYKFSSALLEDYSHVSPAWRDVYLAMGVYNLPGSGDRDNPLAARTRAML